MLLYVLVLIGALTALYAWDIRDDYAYHDTGERAVAEQTIGQNNYIYAQCTFPRGRFAAQTYTPDEFVVGSPNQLQPASIPQYPLSGCGNAANEPMVPFATAITDTAGYYSAIQNYAHYAQVSGGQWNGVGTVIQDGYIISVPSVANDGGLVSKATGMALGKLGARLYEDTEGPQKSALLTGTYDQTTGGILISDYGEYLPSGITKAPIVLALNILAIEGVLSVPNRTPVIVSPCFPCIQQEASSNPPPPAAPQ